MNHNTILIIEDEERIRQLLTMFLEDVEEFSLREVSSAEQALDELSREPAWLCIVDIRLPGMNGMEFIKAARIKNICKNFLIHTGSIELFLPNELAEQGLTQKDVFFKPCDMYELLARIREIVGQPGA